MPANWVDPPRSWVAGELVTATIANEEWRDRMMYLKASPAFTGNVTIAGTLGVTGTINGQTINGTANLLAGTINGQTITSAANFTGTLVTAGTLVVSNGDIISGTGAGAGSISLNSVSGAADGPRVQFQVASAQLAEIRYKPTLSLLTFMNSSSKGLTLSQGAIPTVNIEGALTTEFHVGLVAAKRLYLDGVAMSGDTYITESSANTLDLVSGGIVTSLVSGVMTVRGNVTVAVASASIIANPAANTNLATLTLGDGSSYGWNLYKDTSAGGVTGINEAFALYSLKATAGVRLALSPAGVLSLPAYTAVTFAAGDRYLVVNASGVVHVSALGPAS
jgi:hypothetical protein